MPEVQPLTEAAVASANLLSCHALLSQLDRVNGSPLLLQELLAAMNAAGASHISFNPLTKPNIEKALQQISADVGFRLPADILTSIAESADGDLRNAVETLQLASAGLPLNLKGVQNGKVCMHCSSRCLQYEHIFYLSSHRLATNEHRSRG